MNNNDIIDLESESKDLLKSTKPIDSARLDNLLEECRIKPSDKVEEPDFTLSQNGVGFAPRGNVMALMAEMKHGKTFVNTSLAAAVIRGEFLGLKAEIQNAKVLFFDTEQDRSDGQRIQRRVQYINGWEFEDDDSHKEQWNIYHLREHPFDERHEMIDYAVRKLRPDVVFIDGIRDLLQDFNSLEESFELIQWLMTLSSECNCAIWTVLHVNPNSDKMRGHLGTELGNKVTDVFRVSKNKDKVSGLVTFEVEHVAARHRDVDGWTFKINDDKPFGIPELLDQNDENRIKEANDERKKELRTIMEKYIPTNAAYSRTKLRDCIKAGEHVGSTKAWNIIDEAIGSEVLEVVIGNKLRVKNHPKEQQAEMPF